jgi:hypothetical protein
LAKIIARERLLPEASTVVFSPHLIGQLPTYQAGVVHSKNSNGILVHSATQNEAKLGKISVSGDFGRRVCGNKEQRTLFFWPELHLMIQFCLEATIRLLLKGLLLLLKWLLKWLLSCVFTQTAALSKLLSCVSSRYCSCW